MGGVRGKKKKKKSAKGVAAKKRKKNGPGDIGMFAGSLTAGKQIQKKRPKQKNDLTKIKLGEKVVNRSQEKLKQKGSGLPLARERKGAEHQKSNRGGWGDPKTISQKCARENENTRLQKEFKQIASRKIGKKGGGRTSNEGGEIGEVFHGPKGVQKGQSEDARWGGEHESGGQISQAGGNRNGLKIWGWSD